MRIRVRLFAQQRQLAGAARLDVEVAEPVTVASAWAALVMSLPILAPGGESVRFARNGVYAEATDPLADGDELAIIPPVAGGAPEPYRRIELRADALDDGLIGEVRRAVASDADGAVAIFVGQTRQSPGTPAPGQEAEAARFADESVVELEYEAFEPMVLSVLGDIATEIEERFGVHRIAIIHRVGSVSVGEASVVIAVASAHRGAAFEACRYAIEELKARAPIWKAERFSSGSVWLGAPARTRPEPPTR